MSISKRDLIKVGAAATVATVLPVSLDAKANEKKQNKAALDAGAKAKVYFTKDISAEGIKKIYAKVCGEIKGKVAIKAHTGEPHGPNIIPPAWVQDFMKSVPNSKVVECNVYYSSPRDNTKGHIETLKTNGWDVKNVDILDSTGYAMLPVRNGKWFKEFAVGKNLLNYDSLIALTHFKGHTMGGFGGSVKNLSVGCASGKEGKKQLHTKPGGGTWSITGADFMEHMVEGVSSIIDHFGKKICYINVMRNMSVDCDCAGTSAAKPEIDDIGIFASTDILAVDKACVDAIYNYKSTKTSKNKPLIERIESRSGLRQLTYLKERNMGNDNYEVIEI